MGSHHKWSSRVALLVERRRRKLDPVIGSRSWSGVEATTYATTLEPRLNLLGTGAGRHYIQQPQRVQYTYYSARSTRSGLRRHNTVKVVAHLADFLPFLRYFGDVDLQRMENVAHGSLLVCIYALIATWSTNFIHHWVSPSSFLLSLHVSS